MHIFLGCYASQSTLPFMPSNNAGQAKRVKLIMKMQIVVKTENGNGGPVTVGGSWNAGPRNLLDAVNVARQTIEENRGIGGYRTWIEIDGRVLSDWYEPWPTTMKEAREALA